MGSSKNSIVSLNPSVPMPQTRGPLGTNGDAGDPGTPVWFVGDTPGPLGVQDHADPDSTMFRFRLIHLLGPPAERTSSQTGALECRNELLPHYLQDYLAAVRDPTETWVAQQKLSKAEIQQLVRETKQRLDMFARDEKALVIEIDKVQKDIEVYERIKTWYQAESIKKEVLLIDVQNKFIDLRWGGKSAKVGGINTDADGAIFINDDFRNAHPEVIIQGYVLHEQVHEKYYKEMNITVAGIRSMVNPLKHGKLISQTWAAGQKIESELKAHQVQKEFYESFLSNLRPEKTRSERMIKALRAKEAITSP